MTLSYTIRPVYPVPPVGRTAVALREVRLRGTFANFRDQP